MEGRKKHYGSNSGTFQRARNSVLQMVTFRLYMISRESQLSERLTPKRSIPDRRSSDATWQAGCERFAMSAAVQVSRKRRLPPVKSAFGAKSDFRAELNPGAIGQPEPDRPFRPKPRLTG